MRIAVVYPGKLKYKDLYCAGTNVRGLQALGHEVSLICVENATSGSSLPICVMHQNELISSKCWVERNIGLGIVYTWMGNFVEVVEAMKEAGIYTVSKGDTDGLIGVRANPWPTFVRMFYVQRTALMKARATKYWLKRYACLYKNEDAKIIQNLRNADATIIESEAAKVAFRRFLSYYNLMSLEDKIKVVPNPVTEDIAKSVPLRKVNKIIAVGRWDDPQKDVLLLARSISQFLRAHPETEVCIIGEGGERLFVPLAQQHNTFRRIGLIPHEEIAGHLASSRICLFTSRWEGSPIAGNEALVLGCSIVGTAIPGIQSVCADGPFGTVAEGRAPGHIVAALEREMSAWESGERDAKAIATFWRERLSPVSVARQILAFAEQSVSRSSSYQSKYAQGYLA